MTTHQAKPSLWLAHLYYIHTHTHTTFSAAAACMGLVLLFKVVGAAARCYLQCRGSTGPCYFFIWHWLGSPAFFSLTAAAAGKAVKIMHEGLSSPCSHVFFVIAVATRKVRRRETGGGLGVAAASCSSLAEAVGESELLLAASLIKGSLLVFWATHSLDSSNGAWSCCRPCASSSSL